MAHEEQIWCTVRTKGGERVLLGNVYHSPNGSTPQNHDNLRSMIRESCSKGYKNIVIMGDFQMPNIDWDSWNVTTDRNTEFIDLLQDNYLHQHIDKQTRYRHYYYIPYLYSTLFINYIMFKSALQYKIYKRKMLK
ncbi:hypothetical protein LSH36_581g01009 [Paralvinella palmiformis]|uniref:Endonuclease/exonuclease/phosphatase domain-containing protein n=1 Tax=Paralvinella palmiformis TaxID=53620 RepID=A0AAD9MWZ3_9ANNE|nr:hypothetical protein LSH36_581g01009 [Paralvinella palmiformis]